MPPSRLMHGLVVASEIPLPDSPPTDPEGPADVCFRWGTSHEVPDAPLPGRVLARMPRIDGGGAFFTLSEADASGRTLRFHGLCDVVLAADLGTATFHPDPAADPDLVSVLASGLVMSIILILRGHLVLHASAVEVDGRIVAVTGRSGVGKSTVSTLLCRAGARLVTDDVLRVDITPDAVMARLGAAETRLRPAAQILVSAEDRSRSTADGRLALSLPRAGTDRLPVRCVVVPFPDRSAEAVQVEHPGQVDALMLLAAAPRVVGWEDARTRGEQFTLTAELVSRVPVVVARLPWGPPFADTLGDELLSALP